MRYFNGSAWTADVTVGGDRYIDPAGSAPAMGWPVQAPEQRKRGVGVAAMVLGIVAAATAWLPFVFALGAVLGVLAFVFGMVTRRRHARQRSTTMATVGIILGPVAVLLAVGGFVFTRVVLDVINPGDYTAVAGACTQTDGRQIFDGTIRNDSGRTRSYTISVEFRRQGTDNVLDRTTVEVFDVDPGQEVPWTVNVAAPEAEATCHITDVSGALRFLD